MAQVIAADVSPGRTKFHPTSSHVGFVVDKVEVLILPVLLEYV
jgi:hypothetical protein